MEVKEAIQRIERLRDGWAAGENVWNALDIVLKEAIAMQLARQQKQSCGASPEEAISKAIELHAKAE